MSPKPHFILSPFPASPARSCCLASWPSPLLSSVSHSTDSGQGNLSQVKPGVDASLFGLLCISMAVRTSASLSPPPFQPQWLKVRLLLNFPGWVCSGPWHLLLPLWNAQTLLHPFLFDHPGLPSNHLSSRDSPLRPQLAGTSSQAHAWTSLPLPLMGALSVSPTGRQSCEVRTPFHQLPQPQE